MAIQNQNAVIYSDVSFDPADGNSLVVNADPVFQSLEALFNTDKLERLFRPEYYAELDDLLFEPMTASTAFRLYTVVIAAIQNNEPRVLISNQSDIIADPDNHKYDIKLFFSIRGLDNQQFEYFGELTRPDFKVL